MTTTLLEIGDERVRHMEALEALLVEIGGDVSDEEVDAAITAWLQEADAPLKEKLDAYGAVIREKELRAAARNAEADRLGGLATVDLNAAKRMKDRLRWFFEAHDLQRMETDRFRFTLASNGGKAPIELAEKDPSKLPEWARRVKVEPDVEAIRTRLEQGEDLEFARIGIRGKHLRIA